MKWEDNRVTALHKFYIHNDFMSGFHTFSPLKRDNDLQSTLRQLPR